MKNPDCLNPSDIPSNLLEYLEQTAMRSPDAPAWCSPEEQFSWREVQEYGERIGAALLRLTSLPPDTDIPDHTGAYAKLLHPSGSLPLVAILMEKAPHTAVTMMGSVYAGFPYVVLDTELLQPEAADRLTELLQFLKPAFLLYEESWEKLLSFCPELLSSDTAALEAVRRQSSSGDTLCLTFTSSSSGHPKCVETSHLAVIRYIEGLTGILGADRHTVFGNQAPFCFDACMKDLFVSMKCGGSAWLIPPGLFSRPEELTRFLNDHRINTICWVSSAYALPAATDCFADNRPLYLRTAAFGSELMPPSVLAYWKAFLPDTRFLNLYGPTEATGMSCWYPVSDNFTPEDYPVIPIGSPFPGVEILLLDEKQKPVSDDQTGELYICSNRLAKGYYQAEELTRQVFLTEPPATLVMAARFAPTASPYSIYRTGDLARRLPSGDLIFLGRKDFQVKRMGCRIDLAEIERIASGCPGVGSCCCVQKSDGRIVLYLTAVCDRHVVLQKPSDLTASIMNTLRKQLPASSLPNRIQMLDSLPHLSGGKTDRRKLREQ